MSNSLQPHESQHSQASVSITISRSSLKLTSIESVMPSSHLILCHPLFLLTPIQLISTVLDVKSNIKHILYVYLSNIYATKLLERGTYTKDLDSSANRGLHIKGI